MHVQRAIICSSFSIRHRKCKLSLMKNRPNHSIMLGRDYSLSFDERTELRFKILVVGEIASGKTSFIYRYVDNMFNASYKPTIGVDFAMKTLQWDASTTIKLQLWDISGQERCRNITRVYYQNTAGALILFDLSCPDSFKAVVQWKKDLDEKVMLPNGQPIPCLLVANKCDLAEDRWPQLDKFCEENNFSGYFIASAKSGANVNESLHYLVEKILANDEVASLLRRKTSNGIKIDYTESNPKRRSRLSCC